MPDLPDLTILSFDTSAAHCAAALLCGGRVLEARAEPMARGQAERLVPLLQEVLRAAGRAWRDLDRIGVGVGPGNFTGVRLSVAAARGMALALDIPAVGVTGLEAAALDRPRPCTVALPAPRGQSFVQHFTARGGGAPELVAAAPVADAAPPPEPEALAVAIARIAATRDPVAAGRPAPLYLRPPDAAPATAAVPAILP